MRPVRHLCMVETDLCVLFFSLSLSLPPATQRHSGSPRGSSLVDRRLKQYQTLCAMVNKGMGQYKQHDFATAHKTFSKLLPQVATRPNLTGLILSYRAAASVGLQKANPAMDDCK